MMWRLLLITSFFIAQSLCCIPCNARGKAAMDRFNIFIQSQIDENIETYNIIKQFAKTAQQQVLDYLDNEVRMLDKYAISQIVSEYKKTIDIIQDTETKDMQLLHTIGLHFQQLQEKLKAIIQDAEKRRCPNKQGIDSCGLMVQTYTNCKTCEAEQVVCAGGPPQNQEYFDRCSCVCIQNKCFDIKTGYSCSPCKDHETYLAETLNCGERNLQVTEDEDLTLDCGFEWHAKLKGSYQNVFLKKTDKEPKITDDSYLALKEVGMETSGQYTCTTILNSGMPVSKVIYHVTVLRASEGTREEYQPRSRLLQKLGITPPPPESSEQLPDEGIDVYTIVLSVIAATTAVNIIFISGICIWRRLDRSKVPLVQEPV